MSISKRHKANKAKVNRSGLYKLQDALTEVLAQSGTKFDESLDVQMLLGVDPKKAEQAVRATVVLPNGTGKTVRVLVFATGADVDAAKAAGAEYAGLEELVAKIQEGWTDFDVAIATPATMREVGKLGKVLGPRGLMPTPKAGTVTADVTTAVNEFKAGKVEFRLDKQAGLHCAVGKVSFGKDKLLENIRTYLNAVIKARPQALKGAYILKLAISSTMGPGYRIDVADAEREAML
ncbi:50S ribosomal protein L1 [bacterium]|nr:50S ribosomal protein L1 [bacterium]